jgi:cohesin loading factor subunit SCC2
MKLLQGIRLAFSLNQIIQGDPVVVRGMRLPKETEAGSGSASAMHGYLYSIMKNTKSQRRGILMSLLKQFDESSVINNNMLHFEFLGILKCVLFSFSEKQS